MAYFCLLLTLLSTFSWGHSLEEERTPEQEACLTQWRTWQKKYLAPTPLAAQLKSARDWKIDRNDVNAVLNDREPELKGLEGVTFDGKRISPREGFQAMRFRKKEARDHTLVNHLQYALGTQPDKSLLIVFAGVLHGEHFYLNYPNERVAYLAMPLRNTSVKHNADYHRMEMLFGDTVVALKPARVTPAQEKAFETLAENQRESLLSREVGKTGSMISALGMLPELSNKVAVGKSYSIQDLLRPDVFSETGGQPRAIVILDLHGLNETEFVNELPNGKCLRLLGYNSISFLCEMAPRKSGGYSAEEFSSKSNHGEEVRTSYLATLETLRQGVSLQPKQKELLSNAVKEIKTLKIDMHPIQSALNRRLEEFASSGLGVKYQGFEIKDESMEKLIMGWAAAKDALAEPIGKDNSLIKTPKDRVETIQMMRVIEQRLK